jgi:hypothetical protein
MTMKIIVLNEGVLRVKEAHHDWAKTLPRVPGAILQIDPILVVGSPVFKRGEITAYAIEFPNVSPEFVKYLESQKIPFEV